MFVQETRNRRLGVTGGSSIKEPKNQVRTSLRQTVKPRPSLAVVLTPGFTSISDCLWIVEFPVLPSYYTHTREEKAVISEAWGPPVNCRISLDLLQPPASKPENHHNKL